MSIDAMAAAISHEVGQPLTAVGANVTASLNWLRRPTPDVGMAIKALGGAVEASQRTTDVIRSIRAMFAKQPGRASEFSLNDLVRETASLLDRELAAERVSLQLSLDETLPPIRADRIQIQRVLVNLLTNAIESLGATRRRSRRIVVRSTPLEGGHDVLLEVSDNGMGFAPEEMDTLFEPFFTNKATGSGLGLSLCRNIAGVHGGQLWATRGEAHGATFHLQLPALQPAHAVTATTAAGETVV
jgi:C4-dicarboxylate-specific signal transduction histidine kinase